MKAKPIVCILLAIGSLALAAPRSIAGSGLGLSFVFPEDGQIVAGDNVLVWVIKEDLSEDPGLGVVFETSLDGEEFELLPRQEAPDFDFGQLSHTTALDTTAFPPGLLFLRARFSDEEAGPVIQVLVHRLPQVDCVEPGPEKDPLLRKFDCSESRAEDGKIVSYQWQFGDGTAVETTVPMVDHRYPDFGEFPFQLTVVDDLGFSSTFLALVNVTPDPEIAWDRTKCGCERMTVRITGDSTLGDHRRPQPDRSLGKAPLGRDPTFVSFNFEVTATLEEGSDPALCEEGQRVRGTARLGNQPARHKKACTAGRPDLPNCRVAGGPPNPDPEGCDSHTCRGGFRDGQTCDDVGSLGACLIGGGACQSNNNGVCTEFPLAGANRGNDDYRKDYPLDKGPKLHCPFCGTPTWFDAPGLVAAHAAVPVDYRQEGDFLAFIRGTAGRNCSCHFRLLIDWDGMNQVFRAGTGLTLIQDAESVNCPP